jgi:serine/threonine-protein kinase HipA
MAEQQLGALAVRLHGQRIGVINRLAGDNYLFSFDQAYVDDPNRPTLSLSFKGTSGGLTTDIRHYNVRLPPFFSNLLPEGRLREYLAARAGVNVNRDFFLLATLGADLPGAISVTPTDAAADDHHDDDLDVDVDDDRDQHGQRPMRFSLAGVQLKFSAIMEARGGLTIPVDGTGGSWIVKLPSAQFEAIPENEFAMMELARKIGIPVPNVKLIPISDIEGLPRDAGKMEGMALAVQRFDRTTEGGRIHMEDFAQVFGIYPDDKYDKRSYANIAQVLSVEAGDDAVMDFTRRLAFSVLIGNADMHLKNWSVLYLDRRKPSLAPAYDYVSTIPYLTDDRLALGFGNSKEISEISQDQIRRFADAARLAVNPLWRLVQETSEKTVIAWKSLEQKTLIPAKIHKVIDEHMAKVAGSIK